MNQEKQSMDGRTKEYISISSKKIIKSYNSLISSIHSYSDVEGLFSLTMDNTQIIHSMNLSEKLYTVFTKQEVLERLTRFISMATIQAGKNAAREMRNAISTKEFEEILSTENKQVHDQFVGLINRNNQSIQEVASIKITIVSTSKKTTVVVFGNRMIQSIDISDEFFSVKNKTMIEKELMETVNKAMQEVMNEIQGIMKKNEEEFNKYIIQE